MNPEKAYIQYHHAPTNRWLSVVNLSSGQCHGRHKEICRAIWAKLDDPFCTEREIQELKKTLIQQPYPIDEQDESGELVCFGP